MKKYFLLFCCLIIALALVVQIPSIFWAFADECVAIPIVNSTASESIFCKGIIEEIEDKFIVRAQVCEEDISKVSVGRPVKIICKALGESILSGTVKEISDFAYKISYGGVNLTVIDVLIDLNQKCKGLKSGYTVTVEVVYTEIDNAVILPFEGVAKDNDGRYYVYYIKKDWAFKEYVDVAFEDEKGAVVLGKCTFDAICEGPEDFNGKYVRIKNVGND